MTSVAEKSRHRQASALGTSARKTTSWVEAFYTYTELLPSPVLFRKWAGIAAVAGALERKVWVRAYNSNLYPNLYTILVGPPGVGKTVLTSQVQKFWGELDEHHLASSSVTKASLIDDLRDAQRTVLRPGENPPVVSFNSLLIASNELGVLIPGYENDFMNTLTDIYDGHPYSERRRSKEINFKLDHPQLNLLAATTPSYLNALMPQGAWDQGFISRTILIYSGDNTKRSLFGETTEDFKLEKLMHADLDRISQLYGKMNFTEEAAHAIEHWHLEGGPPTPDHPKLTHYLTRRTAHLLKLCMVASASRRDDLLITIDDYQEALGWLLEAESYMPDIFKSMSSGGDGEVIRECWHFVYQIYVKDPKPIPLHRVVAFLQERTPAHNVDKLIKVMFDGRVLEKIEVNKVGTCVKPKPPRNK